MTEPPKGHSQKDLTIEYADSAKEKMAKDPKAAEAIRDMSSRIRQAMHGFETGKFKSIDEAMRSIGGELVDPAEIDPDKAERITKMLDGKENTIITTLNEEKS